MEIKPTIFVPKIFTKERNALEDNLRRSDAFVLRRCQILSWRAPTTRSHRG
jgi:hypothetical protein